MSLKWLHQNLLNAKVFKGFEPRKFDFADDAVPKRLRDSLFSVDSEETLSESSSSSSSLEVLKGKSTFAEIESSFSENEESFEVARTCPEDCEHENCPFQPRLFSSSEVFFTMESRFSESSMSLVRKVSSLSTMETNSSLRERNEFLCITRIVPLRNNSVIIHWNVKSFLGIRGYKINIDGFPASKIHSAERTSAFINPINMSFPHHFTVTIIPDINGIFSQKFIRKLSLLEPAVFFHSPV